MTLSCQGIGISSSREVAIGEAYLLHHGVSEISIREITEDLIQYEIERFQAALDTTTSQEILDVLAALNRDEGVTIVLITHEPDIAARASRQLTLCDGVLSA